MKTPKILPWIARRSGIPEPRTEELWAEALRHAAERLGPLETSDYWKAAMDRWMALIEAERLASHKAGGYGDQPSAPSIPARRPDRGPWALDSRARFSAERRYSGTPLRASCTIAVNFCLTHKSVSCAARAPRLSSTGAVSDDTACRLVRRVLKIAPAECRGGGL